jgi:hypothetical protein
MRFPGLTLIKACGGLLYVIDTPVGIALFQLAGALAPAERHGDRVRLAQPGTRSRNTCNVNDTKPDGQTRFRPGSL